MKLLDHKVQESKYPYKERTRVLKHSPRNDAKGLNIDRRTIWGNPFKIDKNNDREGVIAAYFDYLYKTPDMLANLPHIKGHKALLCHCAPLDCHGDVLSAFADAMPLNKLLKDRPAASLVFAETDLRWLCRVGTIWARGYDLYSVVFYCLSQFEKGAVS